MRAQKNLACFLLPSILQKSLLPPVFRHDPNYTVRKSQNLFNSTFQAYIVEASNDILFIDCLLMLETGFQLMKQQ